MGRYSRLLAIATLIVAPLAAPLRLHLSTYHIHQGQTLQLTVHVAPNPAWRELLVEWYDATGLLMSSSHREFTEYEQGGQYFYRLRIVGEPGLWQVYTTLLDDHGERTRKHEKFTLIP